MYKEKKTFRKNRSVNIATNYYKINLLSCVGFSTSRVSIIPAIPSTRQRLFSASRTQIKLNRFQ